MDLLILDSTSKSITGVLSGAITTNQPQFTSHYADDVGASPPIIEGSTSGAFTDVTPVTIVPAPASSTRRMIKNITVYNSDTAPITFTLTYADGATNPPLITITLAAGAFWNFSTEVESGGGGGGTPAGVLGDVQFNTPLGMFGVIAANNVNVAACTSSYGVGNTVALNGSSAMGSFEADFNWARML